jgi:hypothetical protein
MQDWVNGTPRLLPERAFILDLPLPWFSSNGSQKSTLQVGQQLGIRLDEGSVSKKSTIVSMDTCPSSSRIWKGFTPSIK